MLSTNFALGLLDTIESAAEIGPVNGSGAHQDPPAKRRRRDLNSDEEQTDGLSSIENSIGTKLETSTEAAIEATEPPHQLDDMA